MSQLAFVGAIELGMIFSIMALGVYMTYRILDIADLTVDGSFVTGAAFSAIYASKGYPELGIFLALLGGLGAGLITAFLHTRLKISALLSGILSMMALYSINLRIMGSKPNIALMRARTIFTSFLKPRYMQVIFLAVIIAVIATLLLLFLKTRLGTSLRATGNNVNMVRAMGINSDSMKILGLALANGLVGLAGGILAQYQGFADSSIGVGTVVIGLASVIIGEVLLPSRRLWGAILSVIVGSMIYRMVISVALELGMKSSDLRLVSASIVALALSAPIVKGWLSPVTRRIKAWLTSVIGKVSKKGGGKNA